MIQYLIIDDEYIAHDIIKEYADMMPNMVLAKHCYDALEALDYLNKQPVDLIFLDLNMPKLKGFDFLRTLSKPPKVIVTTAYQEHALEGYELNVVDYLLKPFSFARFLTAVNKVLDTASVIPTAPPTATTINDKSVFLRSNKRYVQVGLQSILFLEGAGNYTKIITQGETITVREKISDLLLSLTAPDFLQVHKSFVVAVKHIKSVEGNRIAIGEELVPIGKYYKKVVMELLISRGNKSL